MQCGAAAPAAWARRCARVGLLALAGALLGGCALLPASLGGPPSADANADTIATSRRPARPEFVLAVEAPDALRDMLLRNLDLARLQQLPDDARLGSTEFNRLVAAVPAQARTLLQTEGYFDAQVDVQRMSERVPDGRSTAVPGVVRVVVAPGPPTRVQALQLQIEGALQQQIDAGDAEAIALQQALRAAGVLSAGQVFRNADWAGSKQQLLVRLRSAGYATAALAYSNAEVDADAQAATLSVTLDSGPLFRAGPVQITGLKAHDADTVQALAGFGPGAALTETLLLAYQDRLQKTRLFNNVSVSFEPDAGNAAAAPVQVRVTEALLQQATVGAGISANTGPRVTLEHTHRRPFDLPAVVYNKLEWGRDIQSWNGDLQSHPRAGFYRNIFGVQIDRAVSNTDVVLSQRLRLGRSQDTPRIERLYFVELLHSRQADLPGATTTRITSPSSATALSANAHWTWRDLDNQLLPTRGLSVLLQGGAGQAGGPRRCSVAGPTARLRGCTAGSPATCRWVTGTAAPASSWARWCMAPACMCPTHWASVPAEMTRCAATATARWRRWTPMAAPSAASGYSLPVWRWRGPSWPRCPPCGAHCSSTPAGRWPTGVTSSPPLATAPACAGAAPSARCAWTWPGPTS